LDQKDPEREGQVSKEIALGRKKQEGESMEQEKGIEGGNEIGLSPILVSVVTRHVMDNQWGLNGKRSCPTSRTSRRS